MKSLLFSLSLPVLLISGYFMSGSHKTELYNQTPSGSVHPSGHTDSKVKIQVALLLDTSSSMDGLINQAKSRLWNIINTLSTLKYNGQEPMLEIALYEYGNSALPEQNGYIRQVSGFTTDLDLLSELLFSLSTYGGLEYCGTVIKKSIDELSWSPLSASMKLIYIAGNEEFNQGNINYKEAISDALSKKIFVNTIYCGDRETGIRELWKNGADLAKGKYFNINTNREIRYISTPYDDRISSLNNKLNQTYRGYGSSGMEMKRKQEVQDANAYSMSQQVMTERSVSKSSSKYSNSGWDIVDAYTKDKDFVRNMKDTDLPEEFRNLSQQERERKIISLQKERSDIQKEISSLAKEREKYIQNENKKSDSTTDDLGEAITESIMDLAKQFHYTK